MLAHSSTGVVQHAGPHCSGLGRPSLRPALLPHFNWWRTPSEHGPGDATTSGRREPLAPPVAAAAPDASGAGGGQFTRFRNYQRRASEAAPQEQQGAARQGRAGGAPAPGPSGQGSTRGGGGAGDGQRRQPYKKLYWRQLPEAWFARPEYTPASLYEEVVRRCETNTCGVSVLYMMCKLATCSAEARIALSAFAAVRASLVRQGKTAPYGERLAAAFTEMIRAADAPDVLVEALRRAAELGLLLSATRLHGLLRHWGEQGELAKIEEVIAAMPLGGVPYNHVTAYIVIRTAVNLGAQDKAEYYAAAMLQRQIRLTPSAARLLELGRQRQRERQQAMAAAAAAAGQEA